MVATFTWQKTAVETAAGSSVKFVVSGDITELSDFAQLQKELGPHNELDLAGVAHVNSTGVRDWMRFMQAVTAAEQRLVLRRCSPSFVNQLNMISRFASDAEVASVLAPYACPKCDALAERLLELSKEVDAQVDEPLPCATCGTPMMFDDLPATYFAFLKGR